MEFFMQYPNAPEIAGDENQTRDTRSLFKLGDEEDRSPKRLQGSMPLWSDPIPEVEKPIAVMNPDSTGEPSAR
jgi:hypothetical protein